MADFPIAEPRAAGARGQQSDGRSRPRDPRQLQPSGLRAVPTGAPILARNDLVAFNLDLLFEKRLAWADTLTLEGAYYNFNKGAQGWSWYALASYLFASKVGFGQVQPMVRWQEFTPTAGGDAVRTLDAGLNYVIDGHNTRVAFAVQNRNPPTASSTTSYQLGIQIQE